MIHGTKKWSTLTAAVLLALGALALPQSVGAKTEVSGTIPDSSASADRNGTAVGDSASAGSLGTAVGDTASAGSNGTAVGQSAQAGINGTAMGLSAQTGENGTAVGKNAEAGDHGTAVGFWAQATGSSEALGQNTQANHENSVALGGNSVTKEANSVSVGGGEGVATRTITNVTAGDSANDAAVWDQIAKTGQTVSLSTAERETIGEGDGSKTIHKNEIVANDGTVLATFNAMEEVAATDSGFVSGANLYAETRDGITSENYISKNNSAGANLSILDDKIHDATVELGDIANKIQYKDAKADGTNAIGLGKGSNASGNDSISLGTGAAASAENAMAFGNGASASGSGSVAIGSGSTATEANVVSFGAANAERRLTNVAAGVNDTDAVNVGQMNSTIDRNISYLKSSLTRDINKVGAGSAALAALRPEGYDPDNKFSMAAGFGHYKNANAGAIGAFYKPNDDTTFSIGATVGDGESMMNMGVSFKLGSRGQKGAYLTGAALSNEVAALRQRNEVLEKDNASQAKEIADLKADNERMKEQIAMILAKMELSDTVEKSVAK